MLPEFAVDIVFGFHGQRRCSRRLIVIPALWWILDMDTTIFSSFNFRSRYWDLNPTSTVGVIDLFTQWNTGVDLQKNLKNLFPISFKVGFKSTRYYWSYRQINKRCRYICKIEDQNGKPEFVVTVMERGMDQIVLRDCSCKGMTTCGCCGWLILPGQQTVFCTVWMPKNWYNLSKSLHNHAFILFLLFMMSWQLVK